MKTSTIVSVLISIEIVVITIVAIQACKVKREFVVLFNNHLNFCFLVDDRYTLEIKDTEFTYVGGKNSGVIKLVKGGIDPKIKRQKLNGFVGAYKKEKNLRYFEYKLNENYILTDSFIHAEKSPVNLVPYREDCSKIKNNFKKHNEIF